VLFFKICYFIGKLKGVEGASNNLTSQGVNFLLAVTTSKWMVNVPADLSCPHLVKEICRNCGSVIFWPTLKVIFCIIYCYSKLDPPIHGAVRPMYCKASIIVSQRAVICGPCFVSVNWIDPSKTLREQGIIENETLLLRRKFFFSDQNIDSRDPVQLNLLYVQARDAILDGTHPVTQDKACEFAGIQCHIQFGDHNESKHRPGFLEWVVLQLSAGALYEACSTHSSRATCCLQHSFMLPTEWHLKWQSIFLTFSWQNQDRTSKNLWKFVSCLFMEVYIILLIHFVKICQK
jgi:hypothetical protein